MAGVLPSVPIIQDITVLKKLAISLMATIETDCGMQLSDPGSFYIFLNLAREEMYRPFLCL